MCPAQVMITNHNVWSTAAEDVDVDILMPNGLLITLTVPKAISLIELKEDVFEEAQKQPMFGVLRDQQSYIFVIINSLTSIQEEIEDEDERLCDLCPFLALLRLVELEGDHKAKQLDCTIGLVIGKNLKDFDALKNPEVNDFRFKMRTYSEQVTLDREQKQWQDKMLYRYPVRVDTNMREVPDYLKKRLNDSEDLLVKMRLQNYVKGYFFNVSMSSKPLDMIQMFIDKEGHSLGMSSSYLLKFNGRQEYLLGNHSLIQYTTIRDMISNDETPDLVVVMKATIEVEEKTSYKSSDQLPRLRTGSALSLLSSQRVRRLKNIFSWDITDYYNIHIDGAQRVNTAEGSTVTVKVGLFHGGEILCEAQSLSGVVVTDGEGVWPDENLRFDIKVCDIPRMARLCFAIFSVNRIYKSKKKVKVEPILLAWANTNVFDFKNILKSGSITLSMWPYPEEVDESETSDMFKPLGTVVMNPVVEQATCLTITFGKYSDADQLISFPTTNEILSDLKPAKTEETTSGRRSLRASKHHLMQLKEIVERDQLHDICEQEREMLWVLREDCRESLPNSLPKLLISFKWNDHQKIGEITRLLAEWPMLESSKALELLDFAYADANVRRYAVQCIRKFTDEELSMYLLQLVQALKYESYIYCDLLEFLLERAFNNQRIGHFLFWSLRSEMSNPAVSVSFGLILEAYCRGAVGHVKSLIKQLEAVSKLRRVNKIIQAEVNKTRSSRVTLLQEIISQKFYQESLLNLTNPLDPVYKLSCIRVNKCKVMDSKMKPIWLVFGRDGQEVKDLQLIFKNGDDLRQDMLTLQMLLIMDKIWKDAGLDLRLSPYRCISTSQDVGLIEVVESSNTIANIQKEFGSSAIAAFKKGSILAWLKEHNASEAALARAIEEFTLSCAGYCVATYVLGVADRHNDNIMVKTNGQLFHIDFGHILGKFKEKFGIRRERVPFVLTNDFVYVITHGQNPLKSGHFNRFQQHCEQAFGVLRKKGSLIIALFAMMLSSGIPELSSVEDLDYLRDTLVLDMNDNDAIDHFRSKFTEALSNSWKTSLNWCVHNIAKDNKMD